jgi:hypothetical protein
LPAVSSDEAAQLHERFVAMNKSSCGSGRIIKAKGRIYCCHRRTDEYVLSDVRSGDQKRASYRRIPPQQQMRLRRLRWRRILLPPAHQAGAGRGQGRRVRRFHILVGGRDGPGHQEVRRRRKMAKATLCAASKAAFAGSDVARQRGTMIIRMGRLVASPATWSGWTGVAGL